MELGATWLHGVVGHPVYEAGECTRTVEDCTPADIVVFMQLVYVPNQAYSGLLCSQRCASTTWTAQRKIVLVRIVFPCLV